MSFDKRKDSGRLVTILRLNRVLRNSCYCPASCVARSNPLRSAGKLASLVLFEITVLDATMYGRNRTQNLPCKRLAVQSSTSNVLGAQDKTRSVHEAYISGLMAISAVGLSRPSLENAERALVWVAGISCSSDRVICFMLSRMLMGLNRHICPPVTPLAQPLLGAGR